MCNINYVALNANNIWPSVERSSSVLRWYLCESHCEFCRLFIWTKKNQELLGSRQHEPGTLDRFISGTDLTTTSTKYVEREKSITRGNKSIFSHFVSQKQYFDWTELIRVLFKENIIETMQMYASANVNSKKNIHREEEKKWWSFIQEFRSNKLYWSVSQHELDMCC